jgi:signal transduction histidine kinase
VGFRLVGGTRSTTRAVVWLTAALAAAAPWRPAHADAVPAPLIRIASVRELPPEGAAAGRPVRLHGTLVYADEEWGLAFLSDETGVVFLDPIGLGSLPPSGTRLGVEGRTELAFGVVAVAPTKVTPGPRAALPAGAMPTGLPSPGHPVWASVEGVIRRFSADPDHATVKLFTRFGPVVAHLPAPDGPVRQDLVDAAVRVVGVLETPTGGSHAPRLWVPTFEALEVVTPAPQLDSVPSRSVAEIDRLWSTTPSLHRVRLDIVAVRRESVRTFAVEDATGQMEAEIDQPELVQQGSRIRLWGFLEPGGARPYLADTRSQLLESTAIAPPARETGLRTLRAAADVRALSRREAERGYPVSLDAVVTYVDPRYNHLFVQDASAGVFVHTAFTDLGLRAGDRVRVDGITGPGDLAPIVLEPRVRRLGQGELPPPRPVGAARFVSGEDDCLRVELEGTVRAEASEGGRLALLLSSEGHRLTVRMPLLPGSRLPSGLVGATVRVRAVVGTLSNWLRQLSGTILFVARPEDLEIVRPAGPEGFTLPVTAVSDVFRAAAEDRFGHRVRVSGVVLHQGSEGLLVLRDETGALAVGLSRYRPTWPGERVEVVGFPAPRPHVPFLEDAVLRVVGRGAPPAAIATEAAQLLGGGHEGDLVAVRARLLDAVPSRTGLLLILQAGQLVFDAALETEVPVGAPWEPGSQLALTGVCRLNETPGRGTTLQLLLRTPGDVRLVSPPPWWTPSRARWVLGGLLAVLAAAFTWGVTLNAQVRKRTRELREHLAREAELERDYREQLEYMVAERTHQLEMAQRKMLQEERLAALGKLTATVSHELRNPLATIRGSLFLLSEGLHDPPPLARRALERAERNVLRCDDIIEELLEYARVRPLARRPTDIDAWLEEAASEVALPPGIALSCEPASLARLAIDPPRLLRCIVNLVTNAADAIAGAAGPDAEARGRVLVSSHSANGRVEIRVRDDGPGIPADVQDRALEPFFSTKSFGIGLGLAIVKQIMELHGGGVELASRPGETTVTLWLPLLEPLAAQGGAS